MLEYNRLKLYHIYGGSSVVTNLIWISKALTFLIQSNFVVCGSQRCCHLTLYNHNGSEMEISTLRALSIVMLGSLCQYYWLPSHTFYAYHLKGNSYGLTRDREPVLRAMIVLCAQRLNGTETGTNMENNFSFYFRIEVVGFEFETFAENFDTRLKYWSLGKESIVHDDLARC